VAKSPAFELGFFVRTRSRSKILRLQELKSRLPVERQTEEIAKKGQKGRAVAFYVIDEVLLHALGCAWVKRSNLS
jgi:hypothetical protein